MRYLGNPPWGTGVSPPEPIHFIEQHPPGNSLVLGCGTGTDLHRIFNAGWQADGL